MFKKFWVALILAVPILFFAFVEMIPALALDAWITPTAQRWIELTLTTPVVLWAGGFFFVRGWRSIVNRSLNMFTLISLGVGAAYAYGVVAVLAHGIFPSSFREGG